MVVIYWVIIQSHHKYIETTYFVTVSSSSSLANIGSVSYKGEDGGTGVPVEDVPLQTAEQLLKREFFEKFNNFSGEYRTLRSIT